MKKCNDYSKSVETFKIIKVDDDDAMAYCVHFKKHNFLERYDFTVYPVVFWKDINNDSGMSYKDKTSPGEDIMDVFDEERALKKFEGSYCWRGDWEGRVYFTDDEYWGSDIRKINYVYNKIVEYCKSILSTRGG